MNFSRCLCALLCIMLLTGMLLTGSGEELIQDEAQIPARSLTLDDTGSDVAELQTHLTELGYYTGDITGRYGRGTAEAVRAFQKDFGLTSRRSPCSLPPSTAPCPSASAGKMWSGCRQG